MRRKSVFDDFVFYDPEHDNLWIGRRDYQVDGVWRWWLSSGRGFITPLGGPPKHFVEIGREDERTLI